MPVLNLNSMVHNKEEPYTDYVPSTLHTFTDKMGIVIIILQGKSLKPREFKCNFSGCTAFKWQRQNPNPVGQALGSILLIIKKYTDYSGT